MEDGVVSRHFLHEGVDNGVYALHILNDGVDAGAVYSFSKKLKSGVPSSTLHIYSTNMYSSNKGKKRGAALRVLNDGDSAFHFLDEGVDDGVYVLHFLDERADAGAVDSFTEKVESSPFPLRI